MSFAGDLQTFELFDLLGWMASRRKAGTLELTRRSTQKRMGFRDGALQWSSSNDPRETLGQALVRDGLIAEEALFGALVTAVLVPLGRLPAWLAPLALVAGLGLVAVGVGIVETCMARLRMNRVPQFLVAASALAVFGVILLLR